MSRRVAVVGAGWSGLACALMLQDRGARVTLFEAAPRPGGRARRVEVTLGDRAYALDNGQHLMIGAYRETLRLIARAGLDAGALLLRLPFELRYPDGFLLQASRLPAPWHLAAALVNARGFAVADRISILRDVLAWQRAGWRVAQDAPARTLLRFSTAEVARRLWNPLCIAALNVPLEAASACIFLNVLKDSLGADRQSSELLVARRDLSALFPDAAVELLQRAGAELRQREAVLALRTRSDGGWSLSTREREAEADAVVLALPPDRAAALLASVALPALASSIDALRRIEYAPIATVYLRYRAGTRLPAPVFALRDDAARQRFGQWVFDRGALDAGCDGVMSVAISGAGSHLALDRAALIAAIARQLSDEFALPAPLAGYSIAEKRATIQPLPGLIRPPTELPADGLFLAGDAADSPYPSTIEGSVRAGIAAAQAALSA